MVKYVAICGLLAQIALCQPVPENRLELASSGVRIVETQEERDALISLMEKARSYYTLKESRIAYHVKTSFTVTSGGRTEYDGDRQLDEIYSAGTFPLRLHEARGHLLGPLESIKSVRHALIGRVGQLEWRHGDLSLAFRWEAIFGGRRARTVVAGARRLPRRKCDPRDPARRWQVQKISLGATRPSSGAIQTVVVFGLLTADGTVAEAHPLESSDPALVDAALRRVNQIIWQTGNVAPGADREQHELFALVHLTPDVP